MSERSTPQISPDGHWWWDGTVWQPIATLPSGAERQPVAAAAAVTVPAAASKQDSWPAWLPRNPTAEAVLIAAAEQQPGASALHLDKKAIKRQREEAVKQERKLEREKARQARADRPARPRLHAKLPHLSERTWILSGLAALGAVALLGTMVEAMTHGHHAAAPSGANAGPAPSKSGSERARADRFLTYSLAPAVTEAGQAISPLGLNCNTAFSRTCQDAINAADLQIQMSIATIDRGAAPACLAEPVKKVRGDLQTVHEALQNALAGFPSNNHDAVAAWVAKAIGAGQPLPGDNAAATAAKSTCAH